MATFKAMNFLSHFYFERNNPNENMVLGVILPDLIKNAQKDSNLYPLKEKYLFEQDEHQADILKGWKRHVEVDAFFHSSEFFKLQTHKLKQIILPVFENSPVKPFFLAHIGLELILDHLLTINAAVSINTFYEQLENVDEIALEAFLQNCAVTDTKVFFKFFENFISSRYLLSYERIENISYALNRICMRLWDNPFTDGQLVLLTEMLTLFKKDIESDYLTIFKDIEFHLTSQDD